MRARLQDHFLTWTTLPPRARIAKCLGVRHFSIFLFILTFSSSSSSMLFWTDSRIFLSSSFIFSFEATHSTILFSWKACNQYIDLLQELPEFFLLPVDSHGTIG